MTNTEPPTATGKVLWVFTMSLDGFVAGPHHEMDWMTGFAAEPNLVDEYIEATGAVLAGRDGFDSAIGDSRPWGGQWKGPIFVLTHHPEDAPPTPDITFLSCPVEEAVRIGLEAAGGKDLAVFSPNIGAQLLELGLIDEIDIHVAPILLGHGIRLYDNPGKAPIRLHRLDSVDPTAAARLRYRPTTTAKTQHLDSVTRLGETMTKALNELEVVTLFVDDVASTGHFYTAVFGLEVVYQDGVSMVVKLGPVMLNLLHREQAPELVEPATVADSTAGARALFTIRVADVDAVCADLKRHGVQLLNGPIDRPWGRRTAAFADPAGNVWEVAQLLDGAQLEDSEQ